MSAKMTCIYQMKQGPRRGDLCGKNISRRDDDNSHDKPVQFCTQHIRHATPCTAMIKSKPNQRCKNAAKPGFATCSTHTMLTPLDDRIKTVLETVANPLKAIRALRAECKNASLRHEQLERMYEAMTAVERNVGQTLIDDSDDEAEDLADNGPQNLIIQDDGGYEHTETNDDDDQQSESNSDSQSDDDDDDHSEPADEDDNDDDHSEPADEDDNDDDHPESADEDDHSEPADEDDDHSEPADEDDNDDDHPENGDDSETEHGDHSGNSSVDEVDNATDTSKVSDETGIAVDASCEIVMDVVDASGETEVDVAASGETVLDVDASGETVVDIAASGETVVDIAASGETVVDVAASGETKVDVDASGETVVDIDTSGAHSETVAVDAADVSESDDSDSDDDAMGVYVAPIRYDPLFLDAQLSPDEHPEVIKFLNSLRPTEKFRLNDANIDERRRDYNIAIRLLAKDHPDITTFYEYTDKHVLGVSPPIRVFKRYEWLPPLKMPSTRLGPIAEMIYTQSFDVAVLVEIMFVTDRHALVKIGQHAPEWIESRLLPYIPTWCPQINNPMLVDVSDLSKYTPSGFPRGIGRTFNTCKTLDEERTALNLDNMTSVGVLELYFNLFRTHSLHGKSSEGGEKYDDKLYSELPALTISVKKNLIFRHYEAKGQRVIYSGSMNESALAPARNCPPEFPKIRRLTPTGYPLDLWRLFQSSYWVDSKTRLLFRNPYDLTVVGSLDEYNYPYAFVNDSTILNIAGLGLTYDINCVDMEGLAHADSTFMNAYIENRDNKLTDQETATMLHPELVEQVDVDLDRAVASLFSDTKLSVDAVNTFKAKLPYDIGRVPIHSEDTADGRHIYEYKPRVHARINELTGERPARQWRHVPNRDPRDTERVYDYKHYIFKPEMINSYSRYHDGMVHVDTEQYRYLYDGTPNVYGSAAPSLFQRLARGLVDPETVYRVGGLPKNSLIALSTDTDAPELVPVYVLDLISTHNLAYTKLPGSVATALKSPYNMGCEFTPSGTKRIKGIINNCLSPDDERLALNIDYLSSMQIEKLYFEIFKTHNVIDPVVVKLKRAGGRNIPHELTTKKHLIAKYCLSHDFKVIYTHTGDDCKYILDDTDESAVQTITLKNGEQLDIVQFKQTKYFIDKTHKLLIEKSTTKGHKIVGTVDKSGQPYFQITGNMFNALVKLGQKVELSKLDSHGATAYMLHRYGGYENLRW